MHFNLTVAAFTPCISLWESIEHRRAVSCCLAVFLAHNGSSHALCQTSPAPWSAWNWKDIVCSNAGETVRTGRGQSEHVKDLFTC